MCTYYFYHFLTILLGALVLIIGNIILKSRFIALRNKYIIKGAKVIGSAGEQAPIYFRAADVLGFLESFAYAIAYCLGYVNFIGLWLGVKSIGRWQSGGPKSAVEYLEISGEEKRERQNAEINVYLIGNLLSVLLGVLVGIIWKGCI